MSSRGQLTARAWEESATESESWGKQIPSALANPTPDTVTQAGQPQPSGGYIRNVKLHRTISAQHPHESQRGRGGGVMGKEVTSTCPYIAPKGRRRHSAYASLLLLPPSPISVLEQKTSRRVSEARQRNHCGNGAGLHFFRKEECNQTSNYTVT